MEKDTAALLELARKASIASGEAILEVYTSGDFGMKVKSDQSPLTLADTAAHRIIAAHLKATGLPILSEEGGSIPYEDRKSWDYYWLVDPLDGTKEFIKRNGEFTVNIALMKGTAPVAGVVYAPCLDTLYYGAKGYGAYQIKNGDQTTLPITDNTSMEDLLEEESVTIVASRSHSNGETEAFINLFKGYHLQSMGSSLKFMLLADGVADIYPRLAPTMEWDTAAAHAILNAVNRKVYQTDMEHELQYNKLELLNPSFIAF